MSVFARPLTLLTLAAALASCGDGDVRTRIVDAWAETIIVPGHQRFATEAAALAARAAEACAAGLDRDALTAVRARWDAARGAWKRMEVFNFGPYEDYPARLGPNIDFWPARPDIIEAALADGPLDAAAVARKGAAARGLPVIEYLLWAAGDDPEAFAGRRCDYLVGATADLEALAATLAETWRGYVPVLTGAAEGPYTDAQAGFGEILNRMGFTVENIRRDKLGRPLGLLSGSPQPEKVESPYADRSVRDARDALVTLGLLYEGVGDALSLRRHPRIAARPELDRAFRAALAESLAALDAITGPLDEIVFDDPAAVQRAIDVLGALQTVIQVDLIGALAVSRAFNDSDGD
ncbi:MAG: imelysin family protein [Myxococcales bacterium]|nr:imelysin family protein [Myxococcales bacterium]